MVGRPGYTTLLLPTAPTYLAQGLSSSTPPHDSAWGSYHSAWLDRRGGTPNAVWITGSYAPTRPSWASAFELVTP
jgi:hypothetical protein